MLLLWVVSLWLLQAQGTDTGLTGRIHRLVEVLLIQPGDSPRQAAAESEVKEILAREGLPGIASVGDEAAYDFVFLACSVPVLEKAREEAKRHAIPGDAVTYCEAHLRQEKAESDASRQAPQNPSLRDRIERLFKTDQEVRGKIGFDPQKMAQIDREHQPLLEAIFSRYAVPTNRLVGPKAAGDFVVLIQHQSPEFRAKVLPKLKANVVAGQADPGSYAMVFDRSRTDAGKKQLYGENLISDTAHPTFARLPIEDEGHVDQRRAAIGLMRLELYERVIRETEAHFCDGVLKSK